MVRPEIECALLLVAGAAASVASTVAQAERWRSPWAAGATALFGASDVGPSEHVRGMLSLQLGGQRGYQAVNWTTSGITVPESLVREVCGSYPERPSFTYSINEKWMHGRGRRSAEGAEMCGMAYTGGHWDPTAACSPQSDNPACQVCGTAAEYSCQASDFSPAPDAMGSGAYRFLNQHACELGDLSGMHGELEAVSVADCVDQAPSCEAWAEYGECARNPEYMSLYCQKSCGACAGDGAPSQGHVALRSLAGEDAGLAQMSAPFGVVRRQSVDTRLIGLNCDASGPPAAHATNCGCLEYNGHRSPSVGSMTVFRPFGFSAFYLAGPGLAELRGKSVVVQCGSTFGSMAGQPLFCAALQ